MSDAETPAKKQNWFERHRVISIVGAFIIFFGAIGAASGNSQSQNSNNTTATPATTSPQPAATPEVAVDPKKPATPAEYVSALAQATSYANTMHMSKTGLYDQLVSEYGRKFTAPAAQYAIDNVKVDWNAAALASGKQYQNTMHMSPAAIHDQLVSEYGGKFTAAEADYAVAHLND